MSTDQLVLLKSRSQRLAEMFIFPIAALLVGPILRALLGSKSGQRVYPRSFDANLGRQVVAVVLLWGIPMGMMFSAGMVLDSMGLPVQMALKVAAVLGISLIGGAGFGVLIHVTLRLAEAKRAQ